MGSGLILFVIVGAWLVVLVPMALRSHDNATSLRSTERFSSAMRSLARRGGRELVVPRRRPGTPPRRPAVLGRLAARVHAPAGRPLTPATRRRRTLVALLALAVVLAVSAPAGPALLWVPQVVCDLLLVLFVVHLRRTARLRAQRARAAHRRTVRPGTLRSTSGPVRVAGVPDRMPARPAPLSAPLPAPARRHEDPLPAVVAAAGSDWSPVPVPLPTYVGAPVAPPRPQRVVDLTRPGRWSVEASTPDGDLTLLEDGPDLEEILERRTAAGGW